MKKLTVFAMTEKGYAVVRLLLTRYPGLVTAVVASRDNGVVRDYFDEMAELCRAHSLSFSERTDGVPIQTDFVLAVAWRWLINADPARLIVFHDSLLPCYRGFNPLVTALINGDKEIGVTAAYGAAGYDRGDIIAQASSTISYPIRIQDAIKTVIGNYETLAAGIAATLARGDEPNAKPQDETRASYSLWRDEEDYFIDWSQPAVAIKRFIDAVGYPYKGAAATLGDRGVRIRDAEALSDVCVVNRTPGKVIFVTDTRPVVVCGHGLLKILELVDDDTGTSLLPLPRFRVRFQGKTKQEIPRTRPG